MAGYFVDLALTIGPVAILNSTRQGGVMTQVENASVTVQFGSGTLLRKLIILGGGEHASCIYEAAMLSDKFEVMGFTDLEEKTLGIAPYLGGDDVAENYPEAGFIIGVGMIGPGGPRGVIARRLTGKVTWETVIHPKAIVSPNVRLGRGVLIMAGAIVNPGASIGDHCIVNTGAIIEHDCQIGDLCHICPGVVMGGGVKIGESSIVGLGARIRDHISIGTRSFVAMGSVVTKSFPDNSRVLAHPAQPGWDF